MARKLFKVGDFFRFKKWDPEGHPDTQEGACYEVWDVLGSRNGRAYAIKFIDDAGDAHCAEMEEIEIMLPLPPTDAGALEYEEAMRGLDLVKISE